MLDLRGGGRYYVASLIAAEESLVRINCKSSNLGWMVGGAGQQQGETPGVSSAWCAAINHTQQGEEKQRSKLEFLKGGSGNKAN